jgi:hypothetical protein
MCKESSIKEQLFKNLGCFVEKKNYPEDTYRVNDLEKTNNHQDE